MIRYPAVEFNGGPVDEKRPPKKKKKRKKKKKKTRLPPCTLSTQTGGNLDTALESLSRESRRLSPVLDEN